MVSCFKGGFRTSTFVAHHIASEHAILGIRACGEGIGEDLYMAIEECQAWLLVKCSSHEEEEVLFISTRIIPHHSST